MSSLFNVKKAHLFIRTALFFIYALITSSGALANKFDYQIVKQYTKENGLPVNAISDLAIDTSGYLWIATHDGLLRFDGTNFKTLNTNNHPNMVRDRVVKIEALKNGNLLVVFDLSQIAILQNDKFINLGKANRYARHLGDDYFWYADEQGIQQLDITSYQTQLLVAEENIESLTANDQGIYFTDKSCVLHHYAHNDQSISTVKKLDCKSSFDISLSAQNKLAISTDNGLFLMSNTQVKVSWHHFFPKGLLSKLVWYKESVYTTINQPDDIFVKINPDLIVSQLNNNSELLQVKNKLKSRAVSYFRVPSKNRKLWDKDQTVFTAPSPIRTYVRDNNGGLWVGTLSDGLFHLKQAQLQTYGLGEGELNTANISTIIKSRTGELLVGESAGLYNFNPSNNSWKKYKNIHKAVVFLEDEQLSTWVGQEGLCLLATDGECQQQPHIVDNFTELHLAYEQKDGTLWFSSAKGLFNNKGKAWHKISGATAKYVFALDMKNHGVFIASIDKGIEIFKNQELTGEISSNNGLPTNRVRAIYDAHEMFEDSILIGTEDKGLCLWHLDKGLIRCASIDQGLVHQGVHRILPDQQQRLWFSSNKGIYAIHFEELIKYFNLETDYLPNFRFDEKDGMADSEANGGTQSAGIVEDNGVMWFPTQKGIVRVDTNNIETKHKPLTAFVDTVYAANQLQKNNSSITLNDPDNRQLDISLHTIALGQSDGAHYRYRSDPSTAWNDLRDSNKIIFDSLSAGNHTLQFQAARFSGWNGPITELKVQVNPKLIETLWFKFILLALLILGLAIWAARLNKGKLKLEIQVGKRTQELSQALNVISDQKDTIKEEAKRKQRHFLDLSHELRTPLTLVLTPLHTDAPIIDETRRLMKRNGDRLLNLVNQMLKLEQLDVFDESPDQKEVKLANRCRLALEQFKHKADTKHIQLSSDLPHEETYIHGSESEVDTLLVNLISNALKFTPQGGRIHLSFKTTKQLCVLSLEDSGPGVPMAERARIFQRFVRLNQEISEGNGLGLAIVKHIIQRHSGEIQVGDSDLGGARFSVTLPITRQANIQDVASPRPSSQQLILAIDDNADILMLIESILSPHYQVISSQIPAEAITIAQRRVPDLIVTDVGMPDMDGFEVVRTLRQHRDTKGIPVIFATARSHPKDQVTALEAGGDAFLTKPFMPEQLLAYVNRFMTTKQATSTAEAEIKKDVSLLTRAKQIINNHMTNPDFSIDELAQELAMSRSAMYRNFKEEADLLPAEFIKRCRLEHASELLKNTKLSVSKVASLSGYNQAATFTRNFKKHFGHSPKEHR